MKKLILALLTVLCLSACTQNDVALIKDGTMNGYETTTIGKAFDASFDEPKWEAFETDKGQRVVQFTGKVSTALQLSWIESLMAEYRGYRTTGNFYGVSLLIDGFTRKTPTEQLKVWETEFKQAGHNDPSSATLERALHEQDQWQVGTPVIVQWFISTDGTNFQLGAWESDAWKFPNGTTMPIDTILDCVYR